MKPEREASLDQGTDHHHTDATTNGEQRRKRGLTSKKSE